MTKQEKIKEMIKLSGFFKSIETMFNNISSMCGGNEEADELFNKYQKFIFESSILDDSANVYDQFFSEKEITDLLEWYKSDTGRKLVELQPQLSAALMPATMKLSTEFLKTLSNE